MSTITENHKQALLITPYLAAYFNRRDRALGFVQPSFMTRESVSYHFSIQNQLGQAVVRDGVKKAISEASEAQIVAIIQEAIATSSEQHKKKLVKEARRLQKQLRKLHGASR